MDGVRWTVDGGQWLVVSGRCSLSVVSGRRFGGRWSVVNSQWSVVGG